MRMNLLYLVILIVCACKKSDSSSPVINPPPTSTDTTFYKGADISWVTQMEANGVSFYNRNGIKEDAFQLMKDIGMNSIRLRIWVNPSDGWCNTSDVLFKAIRANSLGMKLMIDFHYSDSWADPGSKPNLPHGRQQTLPYFRIQFTSTL